jgi:hypothetical protein
MSSEDESPQRGSLRDVGRCIEKEWKGFEGKMRVFCFRVVGMRVSTLEL